MQGLGIAPGALAKPPRGAPGRGGELDLDPGPGEAGEDRLDQRGLAGARAAGDDRELGRERHAQRRPLALGEPQRQRPLDRLDPRVGIVDPPGRLAARKTAKTGRDRPLGLMDPGQEQAGRALDRVEDQGTGGDLAVQGDLERCRLDPEQQGRPLDQLGPRQARVALAQRLLEQIAEPGTQAERRILGNAEALRELVGGREADAADLLGEPVGVAADQLDRARAVGLEDPRRAQGAEPVRVEKEHDVADRALVAPGGRDPLGEPAADARDLAQPLGLALDHLEHAGAEGLDQLAGHRPADALDHAGAEIGLDALERGRRHHAQDLGAKLQAEARVGLPLAQGAHDLAGGDPWALADHGRGLALIGELDPEHAKPGLGIMEDDPLDQPGQGLRRRLGGGQRERQGGGPVPAVGLQVGLHGAPNLNPAPRFDKRALQPGSGRARRCRRTSSVAPNKRLPITNGTR